MPSPRKAAQAPAPSVRTTPPTDRPWLIAVAFLALGLLIYWPAIDGGFIWDDNPLLVENPLVHAGDGLYRLWFTMQAIDYWPLTASVYWAGWRIWGTDPTGYHVLNIALHVLSSVLLWRIGRRLRIPGAAFAALLFLVHPLQVESVAWIAQLKNTLSLALALLSVIAFAKDDGWNATARASSSNTWFVVSVVTFALAMLSKGSVATVPAILLVLIWWLRGSISRRDLLRMTPFFVIALVLTMVTVAFQNKAEVFSRDLTLIERVLGAFATVWFYLYKSVLPLGLMFIYPQWDLRANDLALWTSFGGVLALTALLWWFRSTTLGRPLFVAWLVFVLAVVPVAGLRDVYFMRYAAVADHYAYLPLIVVVITIAAAGVRLRTTVERLTSSPGVRRLGHGALLAAAACVVAVLSFATWNQAHLYADATTLFAATSRLNPRCLVCETNLAAIQLKRGGIDDTYLAIDRLRAAMRIDPTAAEPYEGLGVAWDKLGRYQEAVDAHARALELDPTFPDARINLRASRERLAAQLGAAGRLDEAASQFERLLQDQPGHAATLQKLGELRLEQGRGDEAMKYLSQAVAAAPTSGDAHNGLASAWRALGNIERAVAESQEAVRLAPSNPYFRNNLGGLLLNAGRLDEAIAQFRQALAADQSSPLLHRNLGVALAEQGHRDEAARELREAIRLDPQFDAARQELEEVLRRN